MNGDYPADLFFHEVNLAMPDKQTKVMAEDFPGIGADIVGAKRNGCQALRASPYIVENVFPYLRLPRLERRAATVRLRPHGTGKEIQLRPAQEGVGHDG